MLTTGTRFGISFFICALAHADAQIVYVDAVEGAAGNTYRSGGTPADTAWLNPDTGSGSVDYQWKKRPFSNNGTILHSATTVDNRQVELTTELQGLPDGPYSIWVFFWDAASTNTWNISAGLNSGSLATYSFDGAGDRTSPVPAASLNFTATPLVVEADRVMYGVKLGQSSVTGGSSIKVFINGLFGGSAARTFYDGIGYESLVDSDGDGLPDNYEQTIIEADANDAVTGFADVMGTGAAPAVTDFDDDGAGDGEEFAEGTNPLDADTDDDSLSDGVETNTGTYASSSDTGTDPNHPDTDGDGSNDGQEVLDGTNPLVPDPPPLHPSLPAGALLLQTDGAWTWFNGYTARFVGGDLYVGYVKNQASKMSMTRYDFDTGISHEFLLGTMPSNDDHDVPTVTVLPDGKVLSTYSRHNPDSGFYARTALNMPPVSLADWSAERFIPAGGSSSYSNCFRLSKEAETLYHFSRAINFNPTLLRSTDNGQTWSSPIHFIKTGTGSVRPYARYTTDQQSRIDLIYTDGHPRDLNNSIYHLFYEDGMIRKTDGTLITAFAGLPVEHDLGERGSTVYSYSSAAWGAEDGPDAWIPNGRAWTWDIHYGHDGHPVCVFQVQVDNVTGSGWNHDRIYYYYARWTGSSWERHFIAHGGRGLYSNEDDYGGGMTIDPENPNVVYISSNAQAPFDRATLAPSLNSNNERYELYRGVTQDGGSTWTWETLTSGSDADNLRPFVPIDHHRSRALVWFRGTYQSYVNFDCDVYGYFTGPMTSGLRMQRVQWLDGAGVLQWVSAPGKSYRITASTDLKSFPVEVDTGINAQGDTTTRSFTVPPSISGSPSAFFRVEEE